VRKDKQGLPAASEQLRRELSRLESELVAMLEFAHEASRS